MEYDVIVVGGGHAGIEATLAAARMGYKACLITLDISNIGQTPCNPSIGGPAKGVVVREIDALGGQMGITTDNTSIIGINATITKYNGIFKIIAILATAPPRAREPVSPINTFAG